MEREISLSSFAVKDEPGNRPGDFTTRFSRTLNLENTDGNWYIGLNKIISMSFSWTNINSGYDNQKIAYSKDGGKTFTDIDFPKGVWDYNDINNYIKEKTKIVRDDNEEFPIDLTFDSPTFRVIVTLDANYQLDLTKSNFGKLIGFDKVILRDERNVSTKIPNLSEDTDVLNINCDLVSDSLVAGRESDIIYSFSTGILKPSFNFTFEPHRIIYNPINKTRISSIRIYVTDGLRRPVYLNHADTAFSLILKKVPY